MIKGFKEFVMRGNVVDLAIAVVVGAAFGAVISGLVADILTPLLAAIFGKPNFADLTFTVHHSEFLYGDLINKVITFVTIVAAIYFLIVVPLNKLAERRVRGATPPPEELPQDVALLTEIRDLLAQGARASD